MTPMQQRLRIVSALNEARNECERVAAEVALRVLERRHPWLKPKPLDSDGESDLNADSKGDF